MIADDKPLVWLHGVVKSPPFSAGARVEAGYLLRKLQKGASLSLPHSRPMPTIGRRVHELRVIDRDNTWRIIYRIDSDAIVIGEVFAKRTQQTPQQIVQACRQRFAHYDSIVGGM
jgi:phage-related protein